MKRIWLAALALVMSNVLVAAAHAGYPLILQGNDMLALVARDGEIAWQMPWGGIHDLHVLEGGNIMVQQGPSKIVEIEMLRKEIAWSYDSATANGNQGKAVEVHSFQPLADGSVMIAESGPGRIIEVDREGKLLKEIKLKIDHPHPHTDTRQVRKLENGNYLVCHEGDGVVREYDGQGKVVWAFPVPLFDKPKRDGHGPEAFGNKCFAALRRANGNTLITTGNGHGVIEVTPDKKLAWQLQQNDLPGITLAWTTTIDQLPNGNYLLGNCHAGKGQPLLVEFEPRTKKVVWTLDRFDTFGNSVSNCRVLDTDRGE